MLKMVALLTAAALLMVLSAVRGLREKTGQTVVHLWASVTEVATFDYQVCCAVLISSRTAVPSAVSKCPLHMPALISGSYGGVWPRKAARF